MAKLLKWFIIFWYGVNGKPSKPEHWEGRDDMCEVDKEKISKSWKSKM